MIFRLRNGHNKLRHHMYSRLKVGDSSGCPCGEPRQDASHILQDCTLFKEARDRVWNSEFPLWRKLYGSRQDLEMTAAYIRETIHEVLTGRTKKKKKKCSDNMTKGLGICKSLFFQGIQPQI